MGALVDDHDRGPETCTLKVALSVHSIGNGILYIFFEFDLKKNFKTLL